MQATDPSPLVGVIQRNSQTDVAFIRIDGTSCYATIDIDAGEWHRRGAEPGAVVTDREMLAALWEIPAGGVVPIDTLGPDVIARLRERRLVETDGALVARLFQPIGTVRSLSFAGSNAIRNAADWPPTYERTAFQPRASAAQVTLAEAAGVGIARVTDHGTVDYLVTPRPAVLGVPGLFRWWIAELCFAGLVTPTPRP